MAIGLARPTPVGRAGTAVLRNAKRAGVTIGQPPWDPLPALSRFVPAEREATVDPRGGEKGQRRATLTFSPSCRFYAADPEAVACGIDVLPADSAAIEDGLKPLAISQTAMTISCRASGAMKKPSESSNMLPSGATM